MSLCHFLAEGNNDRASLVGELVDNVTTEKASSTKNSSGMTSERGPSALNLQDWLPSSSNHDILEIPALHLELDPKGGDECPRPQSGIDGPALLHGLSSARGPNETTVLCPDRYCVDSERDGGESTARQVSFGLDAGKSLSRERTAARDFCTSPNSDNNLQQRQ